MNLIKQYVRKRKGSYFASVLLAIVGVVAGLFFLYIHGKNHCKFD